MKALGIQTIISKVLQGSFEVISPLASSDPVRASGTLPVVLGQRVRQLGGYLSAVGHPQVGMVALQ